VLVHTATQAHVDGTLGLGSDANVAVQANLDAVNDVGTIHSFFAGYCFCVHVYIITDLAFLVNRFTHEK
jgi:hypothetical protein